MKIAIPAHIAPCPPHISPIPSPTYTPIHFMLCMYLMPLGLALVQSQGDRWHALGLALVHPGRSEKRASHPRGLERGRQPSEVRNAGVPPSRSGTRAFHPRGPERWAATHEVWRKNKPNRIKTLIFWTIFLSLGASFLVWAHGTWTPGEKTGQTG